MSVSTTDAAAAAPAPGTGEALRRRSLGVPDLVFFIVAASAPLTAVAGGQAATYLVTGNKGVPFLFIPLGILLALFALLILGGHVLRGFTAAMILGIFVGTYSSIYVSSSLLITLGLRAEPNREKPGTLDKAERVSEAERVTPRKL